MTSEAAPQEWEGVWQSQNCIAMKYKVATVGLCYSCVLGKDIEHKIVEYATNMMTMALGSI